MRCRMWRHRSKCARGAATRIARPRIEIQDLARDRPEEIAWVRVILADRERGDARHAAEDQDARAAVGAPSLPLGAAVEIDAVVEID